MAEQLRQEREVDRDGLATSKTTRVVDDTVQAGEERVDSTITAARVVWFIADVLLVLLAFRFVLVLLGANAGSGFVDFIYDVSHPFAAPFFGIFGYKLEYGVSRVELGTLIAMVVYALVAFGITRLLTIKRPNREI